MARAADNGLLHLDLKPDNMLVHVTDSDDVEVTIIDFGVAKECVDGALKCVDGDSFAGTPLYMSPEQSVWHGPDGTWASLKRIEGVDAHAASRRSKGGSGKKGSKKRSRKKSSSSLFHERKDVDANMIAHSSDVYAFAITAYALMVRTFGGAALTRASCLQRLSHAGQGSDIVGLFPPL